MVLKRKQQTQGVQRLSNTFDMHFCKLTTAIFAVIVQYQPLWTGAYWFRPHYCAAELAPQFCGYTTIFERKKKIILLIEKQRQKRSTKVRVCLSSSTFTLQHQQHLLHDYN